MKSCGIFVRLHFFFVATLTHTGQCQFYDGQEEERTATYFTVTVTVSTPRTNTLTVKGIFTITRPTSCLLGMSTHPPSNRCNSTTHCCSSPWKRNPVHIIDKRKQTAVEAGGECKKFVSQPGAQVKSSIHPSIHHHHHPWPWDALHILVLAWSKFNVNNPLPYKPYRLHNNQEKKGNNNRSIYSCLVLLTVRNE